MRRAPVARRRSRGHSRPHARAYDERDRSGDGAELERGEGDGLAGAPPPLTWAGVEPTVFAPRGGVAWLAVERAASIPLAAQLMVVSNPMPTARTSTRRRQYVACEIVAGRGRAPRGGSAFDRRLWSISVTMEDSHRMSLKARRKKASSAHALPPPSRPRSRGRPSGARAHGERARTRRRCRHAAATAAGHLSHALQLSPAGIRAPGRRSPVEGADRLVVELELKPKTLRVSRCIGHIGTATLPAWS